MKNHVKVNNQLLKTNKTWKDLKNSQKEWIKNLSKDYSLDEVYEKIQERDIWIPFIEIKKHCNCKK